MSDYILYDFFRSSCATRVRIALNLKGINYETRSIDLANNEQHKESHQKLNPSGTVPLLICQSSDASSGDPFRIGQSVAILEYLEEAHPDAVPLLPSDLKLRAVVRTLVNIIAADTQPITNYRVTAKVEKLGGDEQSWNKDIATHGLDAYERSIQQCTGRYSVGDKPTLADICLVPAVWNASIFGVDLSKFPHIMRIVKEFEKHPAVIKAWYYSQPDTPDDQRTHMPQRE